MAREQSRPRREDGERKRAAKKVEQKEIPWGAIVVAVAVMVAALGWCVMASAYSVDVEGQRLSGNVRNPRAMFARSVGQFIGNGFRQLPNLPAVVGHVVTKKFWLILAILAVEGVVIVAGLFLFKLDKQLSQEAAWKKPRKLATPKGDEDDPPPRSRKPKPKSKTLPPPGHERRRRKAD
jgi:hypothetical protein